MVKKIIADFSLCTGCAICTLACSEAKTGGFNPRLARLRIDSEKEGLVSRPVLCNQCENAYCEQVCPTNAIVRNDEDILIVHSELCTGCGKCNEYCPNSVVVVADKCAGKCDLCGGNPQCIFQCPTGALKLSDGGEQHE